MLSRRRKDQTEAMRVARGRIVGNTVVLEGEVVPAPLAEGSQVTVYLEEPEGWALDEASWKELDEARAAVARGEGIDMEEVLARLDAAGD